MLYLPSIILRRRNLITAQGILSSLHIEGYRIVLPNTWQYQARLILFAKDDLKVTEKVSPKDFSDFQQSHVR